MKRWCIIDMNTNKALPVGTKEAATQKLLELVLEKHFAKYKDKLPTTVEGLTDMCRVLEGNGPLKFVADTLNKMNPEHYQQGNDAYGIFYVEAEDNEYYYALAKEGKRGVMTIFDSGDRMASGESWPPDWDVDKTEGEESYGDSDNTFFETVGKEGWVDMKPQEG